MFTPTSTFFWAQAIQNLIPTVSGSSNRRWFVAKTLPLLDKKVLQKEISHLGTLGSMWIRFKMFQHKKLLCWVWSMSTLLRLDIHRLRTTTWGLWRFWQDGDVHKMCKIFMFSFSVNEDCSSIELCKIQLFLETQVALQPKTHPQW